MAEQKLFLRRATGLVRDIGFTTGLIIILAHVIGVGWQKRVFQASGWTPLGSEKYFLGLHPVVMAFIVGGIGVLFFTYAYSVMTTAMPRSGGGYVFISRILGPALGFVCGGLTFMSTSVSYGQIGVFCWEAFGIFAPVTGIDLPAFMTSAWGITFFGALVVVIFAIIGALGVRQWGTFLHVIFWIPVVILVLVLLVFLFSSQSSVTAGVQAIYGHDPGEYTQAAIDQGMATAAAGNTYWGAVRTAIIGAIWAFGGWAATTFVAGEVREATRSVPKILFGANIAIIVLYIIVALLLVRMGSVAGGVEVAGQKFSFMSAVAYLGPGGGSFADAGLPTIGPWMSNFAAIGARGLFTGFLGSLLAFLILVFAILWAANDIPPFILVTSRTIFAMAFDRMLPERLGAIHEDYHSPVNAIILSTVIAILLGCTSESNALGNIGGFVGRWLNPASMLTATDVWSGIWDIFIVVALIFFPLRLPQLFERGPWRHSKNTTQVMGVIGLLFALYYMYSYLFDPHGWNVAGLSTLDDASALIGGGVVILIWIGLYFFYSNRAKVTGVNLTTIFADIPPE